MSAETLHARRGSGAAAPWATLRFGSVGLALAGARPAAADWALRFLAPQFALDEAPSAADAPDPVATLTFADDRGALPAEPDDAEAIHVRRSASPFFTIAARRWTDGDVEAVAAQDGTAFAFDRAARTIVVVVGDGARGGLALVELIRDLVLKAVENAGAVVLHAAAVDAGGAAVLVVGGKGSGKSTTALELVRHHGLALLSGDKVVVDDAGGELRVRGWPDYPHLGYATLRKHDGLTALAGVDPSAPAPEDHAFSATGKYAVDPFGFRTLLATVADGAPRPVAGLVLPAIGPGEGTALRAVDRADALATLRANVDSAFAGVPWNGYTERRPGDHGAHEAALLRTLADRPAVRVEGPGDLAGLDLPRWRA